MNFLKKWTNSTLRPGPPDTKEDLSKANVNSTSKPPSPNKTNVSREAVIRSKVNREPPVARSPNKTVKKENHLSKEWKKLRDTIHHKGSHHSQRKVKHKKEEHKKEDSPPPDSCDSTEDSNQEVDKDAEERKRKRRERRKFIEEVARREEEAAIRLRNKHQGTTTEKEKETNVANRSLRNSEILQLRREQLEKPSNFQPVVDHTEADSEESSASESESEVETSDKDKVRPVSEKSIGMPSVQVTNMDMAAPNRTNSALAVRMDLPSESPPTQHLRLPPPGSPTVQPTVYDGCVKPPTPDGDKMNGDDKPNKGLPIAAPNTVMRNAEAVTVSSQYVEWDNMCKSQSVTVTNHSDERRAFKLKCSDNKCFAVNPVFFTLEPRSSQPVTFIRQHIITKPDKFVIAHCKTDKTSAQDTFASIPKYDKQITLLTVFVRPKGTYGPYAAANTP